MIDANKAFSEAAQANVFEKWQPNISPYHGGVLGASAVLGHAAGIPYGIEAGMIAPIVLGSSPKVNKGLIKTMGGINRGYNRLPNQLLPMVGRNIVNSKESSKNSLAR